jgi:uncharacterized membrane protein HdeD (DUF308 family)
MKIIETETEIRVINSRWLTAIAVLMIVLGLIAIVFPYFATVASTLVFGWLFIFAGIAQIIYAFHSSGAGKVAWKLILGALYLVAGIFVVAKPLAGVLAFTLVLGITIFVQGIIQVAIAFRLRRLSLNWGWVMVSGIVGIVFGIVVWSSLPSSAVWLIGTLIGVNLLFDGAWMLTLHSGQRHVLL